MNGKTTPQHVTYANVECSQAAGVEAALTESLVLANPDLSNLCNALSSVQTYPMIGHWLQCNEWNIQVSLSLSVMYSSCFIVCPFCYYIRNLLLLWVFSHGILLLDVKKAYSNIIYFINL